MMVSVYSAFSQLHSQLYLFPELIHQPQMEAILSVEKLISNLLSSSEDKQLKGQSMLDMMKEQDPNSLSLDLAELVGSSNSHDCDFRKKCADLLCNLLTDDEGRIWNNLLSVSTQCTIKSILLIRINLEESKSVIGKLCHNVAKLCNVIFVLSNKWPELVDFLQECITSDSSRLKESFFLIFSKLAKHICQTLVPDVMILYSLFLKTMNDDTLGLEMRIAALSGVTNFILCLSSLNELKRCQNLLPVMIKTLTDAFSKDDQDVAAQYVLKLFIELAKNEPRFFRLQLVDVVSTMFEIADAMNLEEKTRHLAHKFVLTLVEAREKAPGMMKKLPLFTSNYFALLLNLLLDIKDKPGWHSAENYLDTAGETDNYKFGLKSLERFSNALGGKTVAPIAVEQVPPYLAAPEWEKRHAALLALTFIAEGCSKMLMKYLDQVVNMVLHFFQDPHPRVRWAAFGTVAELSTVFSPAMQERHHNQVVPALAASMDDFQNPRVQAMAVVAVMNYFCGSENPETLVPYLDAILDKLLVLIQNDNLMVQQEAIHALGIVAQSSEEHFQKYYGFVLPHLKAILINANDKSNHMLHGKALGCISMVGLAVGIEKFRDDIYQVIGVLKLSQESPVKEFGTIFHILKAWGRICTCMGKDFLPYMSTVMPLLVKCVQLESDNLIDELDHSIHKVKFGNEMIYAKRSQLLEVKSLACCFLGLYARILEEDFYPWIPQAISILIPLLKYYNHNDVRENTCVALYMMLESAKLAVEKGIAPTEKESYFKQLPYDIVLALRDALYSEPEAKVCARIFLAFGVCLLRGPLLTEDMLRTNMDAIKHVIAASSRRKGELTEREKSEDFDVEEAEFLREEIEQEEQVSKIVGDIFLSFALEIKAAFMPFYDELSAYLMPIKGMDKTTEEKIACINTFEGLVIQCSEAAIKYRDIYPFLLEWSNDENPRVRERALFGLGACAPYDFSCFKPFVGEALSRINQVITHLRAREPENERAYDNAVSALGKICVFQLESIDQAQQIIPAWLSCLPIRSDVIEAKSVHYLLCLMVERSDKELLGPKYEHFPKILSIFAEVLCAGKEFATEESSNRIIKVLCAGKELATVESTNHIIKGLCAGTKFAAEESTNHMITVLRNLQKTIPPATWESAWSLLLPQHEMELESVLSPETDTN